LALAGAAFQHGTTPNSCNSQVEKVHEFKDKGGCAGIPALNQFLWQTAAIFIKSQPPVHILEQ
jgi:hypothetical protein